MRLYALRVCILVPHFIVALIILYRYHVCLRPLHLPIEQSSDVTFKSVPLRLLSPLGFMELSESMDGNGLKFL